MKNKFSILLIIFVLFLYSFKLFSNQSLEDVMEKRTKFRKNGWCLISYEKGIYHGEIQSFNNDGFFVKIFDFLIPPKDWKIVYVQKAQVHPLKIGKFDNKQALLTHLVDRKLIISSDIYKSFQDIDRSWFCPTSSYYDIAPDIGYGACISSPHFHSITLELCKDILKDATSILDIGSGSGNFTALLSDLAPKAKITGIEIILPLVEKSKNVIEKYLKKELKNRITIIQGNGNLGYEKDAPYDVIHVAYMCKEIPFELLKQLKVKGRLLVPIADGSPSDFDNRLLRGKYVIVDKINSEEIMITEAFTCNFVPDASE